MALITRLRCAVFCSRECAGRVPLGTRIVRPDGRVELRVEGGWVWEHRFVMEHVLGRALLAQESVHHTNGDRSDNRAENLEVRAARRPHEDRRAERVTWARRILAQYGDKL